MKLLGFLLDGTDLLLWPVWKLFLNREGYRKETVGIYTIYGKREFICEARKALQFIESEDRDGFIEVKKCPVTLIQAYSSGISYGRIMNGRIGLGAGLESYGYKGIASGIMNSIYLHGEYSEMNLIRKRLIRPEPKKSVTKMIEWLKRINPEAGLIDHLELYKKENLG